MSVQATLRRPKSATPGTPIDVETTPVASAPAGDNFDAQLGSESAPAQSTAVDPASAPSGAVQQYTSTNRYSDVSGGALQGDFDESDLRYPTLRIVNGSGQLSQSWPQGTVLLGDEQLLPPPDLKVPKPEHVFRFIPLAIQKQFRENLSDDQQKAGVMPRVVSTIAEVEALGGTTQWLGDTKPSWGPSARCILLIEKPEAFEHPNFVQEFGGKLYAIAAYYTGGGAYRVFAQILFNTALTTLLIPVIGADGTPERTPKGHIKQAPYLPKKFWNFRVKKVVSSKGGFSTFQPEIRLHKDDSSEEIREFLKTLLATEAGASAAGE